jgi:excisionase family DNA binding protein
MSEPVLLTVPEAARMAGVSSYIVRRWVHQGEVDSERVGRQYRITEASLVERLERGVLPAVKGSGHEDPHLVALVDRLREARQVRDLTQAEVAEGIGVHWTTVYRIEAHRVDPRASLLLGYARVVGVMIGAT